ncbi:MAG: hypothetical protein K9K66_04290 [Desulfarculaceae bacterium]|nr:hypothetical protein [Desulfarculaceae bacterium]MCF8073262.1 hypothetical protein [Desulfarculaceae bacterium]MCF8100858.1 hypothetical protein [Desulfarculaceae bacterium]
MSDHYIIFGYGPVEPSLPPVELERHECGQCHAEVHSDLPLPLGWIPDPRPKRYGALCGNCANSWALGRHAA